MKDQKRMKRTLKSVAFACGLLAGVFAMGNVSAVWAAETAPEVSSAAEAKSQELNGPDEDLVLPGGASAVKQDSAASVGEDGLTTIDDEAVPLAAMNILEKESPVRNVWWWVLPIVAVVSGVVVFDKTKKKGMFAEKKEI